MTGNCHHGVIIEPVGDHPTQCGVPERVKGDVVGRNALQTPMLRYTSLGSPWHPLETAVTQLTANNSPVGAWLGIEILTWSQPPGSSSASGPMSLRILPARSSIQLRREQLAPTGRLSLDHPIRQRDAAVLGRTWRSDISGGANRLQDALHDVMDP